MKFVFFTDTTTKKSVAVNVDKIMAVIDEKPVLIRMVDEVAIKVEGEFLEIVGRLKAE
jgi:hypothetical protein